MMPPKPATEGERRAALLVAAHVLLVIGACAGSGYLRHGTPTEWLGLACVTGGAALWMWVHCARRLPALPPLLLVGSGVLLFFALGQPFFLWRMVHHQAGPLAMAMRTLSLLVAILAVSYVLIAARDRRQSAIGNRQSAILFGALIAVAVILRVLLILDSPDPGTDPQRFLASWASDIYSFTNGGADRLLHGQNPYTGSYPPWTADGRGLWNYYTYPPGFLILSLPGRFLLGDVRWTHLLAILVAAWLLYRMARGAGQPERELLVLLLLMHPRSLYLHEQAFTEPVVAAVALAMAAAAVEGKWIATGALLGLLAMTKQYGLAFAPALLRARAPLRSWLALAGVAAALLAPFALWNAGALYDNLVVLFLRVLPQYDGLNWVTAVYHLTGKKVVSLLSVATLLAVPVWWRQRPGAAGYLSSGSLTLLLGFLFGRYAFFNYYWIAGVLALAQAAAELREEES